MRPQELALLFPAWEAGGLVLVTLAAYLIADIGYSLQEWNFGTPLPVTAGWMSLLYRIHAEEQVLSRHADWPGYVFVPARSPPVLAVARPPCT